MPARITRLWINTAGVTESDNPQIHVILRQNGFNNMLTYFHCSHS